MFCRKNDYPVPKRTKAKLYGFAVTVKITPHGAYGDCCLQAAGRGDSSINPATDLPAIMKCIKRQAREIGFIVS